MKNFFILLVLCCATAGLQAQTNVGINNPNPAASAALDVTSTTQGMLVPRMTQTQRNAIVAPATGLMIFQTDNTPGFYFYDGTTWTSVNGTNTGSSLQLLANKSGGTGESPATSGTTAPSTISFNNLLSSPTNGNTWTSNNTFTVGAGQDGIYMIQVRLHGPDAATVSQTVGYSLIIQINGLTYGNVGNIYGPYPTLNIYTPAGTKARGEIVAFVKLAAGDNFKILAIGANSGTAPPTISADAGSNITVMKTN